MKFGEYVRENRRLEILLVLEASPGYKANHYLVCHALNGMGNETTLDVLHGELAWLEEQGLIETRREGDVVVVRARQRGIDVASGLAVIHGVKRPQPD